MKKKHQMKEVEQTEAAIQLQRVARGRLARRLTMRLKAEKSREIGLKGESEKEVAAVRIQSIVRGRATRSAMKDIRSDAEREKEERERRRRDEDVERELHARLLQEEERQSTAAVKIQSVQKGRKARKEVAVLKQVAHEEKSNKAATTIQAVQRGRLSRRRSSSLKEEKEAKEQAKAAVQIQKIYRGHQSRGDIKRIRAERREALERDADNDGPKRAVRRAGGRK